MLKTITLSKLPIGKPAEVALPLFITNLHIKDLKLHTIMTSKDLGKVDLMGDAGHIVFNDQSMLVIELIELSGRCYLATPGDTGFTLFEMVCD